MHGDYNSATQRTRPMDVGDLVTWEGYWGAGDDNAIGIVLSGPDWNEKYTIYWIYSDYSLGQAACLKTVSYTHLTLPTKA